MLSVRAVGSQPIGRRSDPCRAHQFVACTENCVSEIRLSYFHSISHIRRLKQLRPANAHPPDSQTLYTGAACSIWAVVMGSETASPVAAERSAAMYTSIAWRACSGVTITGLS